MNDTFYLIQDVVQGQLPVLVWTCVLMCALLGFLTRGLREFIGIKAV